MSRSGTGDLRGLWLAALVVIAGATPAPALAQARGGAPRSIDDVRRLVEEMFDRAGVPAPQAASPRTPPPDEGDTEQRANATLRLEIVGPDARLFVGQLEPVEIRLVVPDGADLREVAPPVISGEGLTISPLANDHPDESRERIDGTEATVLTWTVAVSAVKPGAQTLTASLDGVVAASRPAARSRARHDLLGDDFFDDDFLRGSLVDRILGGLRQEPVHLSSRPLRLDAEPLPEAGRPADFGGAVGEFHFDGTASPTHAAAGDPVTFRLRVAGRGNFGRVHVAGLSNQPGFKSYPPEERFAEDDPTGVSGTKSFEQTLIPEGGPSSTIPSQRFSYFDPQLRTYVTLATDALPLTLTVANHDPAVPAPTGAQPHESRPKGAYTPGEDRGGATGALTLRTDLGTLRRDTRPLAQRPTALTLFGVPLLTLLSVGIVAWRSRLRHDPARVRKRAAERVVSESLRAMEAAVANEDAAGFHDALRRALQARLARRTTAKPASLTAADVERSLADDPQLAAAVRRLFEHAEAAAYAGRSSSGAALRVARGEAIEALARLGALA